MTAVTTNGPVAVTVNGSVNAGGVGVAVTSMADDVAGTVTVQGSSAATIRIGSVTSTSRCRATWSARTGQTDF